MPKNRIVWDKGGDEDKGRSSNNSRGIYRENQKPYKKGRDRGHDNLNNTVKLQNLESNPFDDVEEGAKFNSNKRKSTEHNPTRRAGLGLNTKNALRNLLQSNEKENSRKKEEKVKAVDVAVEEEPENHAEDSEFFAGFIKDRLGKTENAETRTKNERNFRFETTVENCLSESSSSPKVYDDDSDRKRPKESKKKKRKKIPVKMTGGPTTNLTQSTLAPIKYSEWNLLLSSFPWSAECRPSPFSTGCRLSCSSVRCSSSSPFTCSATPDCGSCPSSTTPGWSTTWTPVTGVEGRGGG